MWEQSVSTLSLGLLHRRPANLRGCREIPVCHLGSVGLGKATGNLFTLILTAFQQVEIDAWSMRFQFLYSLVHQRKDAPRAHRHQMGSLMAAHSVHLVLNAQYV